ncbi:hypothetical protein BKG82_26410 [Mycobacteroides chelonae]|uniref:Uncharacterized protein n=2 Tax=Mycobacteroides chelonae TaxID=1774 RepID=A0A1S1LFY1_MYCCH|nr:hypothetical protein BKG82_26410 [Mycobacteroides chelonae]
MRHQQALNALANGAAEQPAAPSAKPHWLTEALGLHTIEDIAARWAQISEYAKTEVLTVPVGVDATGKRVYLNIDEIAVGGSGVHGMLLARTHLDRVLAENVIAAALRALNPPKHLQVVAAGPYPGYQIADTAFGGHEWDLKFGAWLTNELTERTKLLDAEGALDFRSLPIGTLPRVLVIADPATEFAESRQYRTRYSENLDRISRLARQGRAVGIHLLVSGSEIPLQSNRQPCPFTHNLTYGLVARSTGSAVIVPAPLRLPNGIDDDVAGTPVELLSAGSLNQQVSLARAAFPLYKRTVRDAARDAGFALPPPAPNQ